VRPYSKGQKNDFRDAEAIAEAVQRPTMKFVATKTADQLDLQALVARSTTLQSEAGYIDARPQRRRIDEILLRQPDHTFGSKTVSMARERPGGFTPVTGLYPTACVAAAPIRPSPQRADECISPLFQWPRVRQTRP
jgi:transposase